MWEIFEMETLKDYHDFYLKSDVHLLADFFEKFRDMCMSFYGLDPCHYFSAPALSWDASLKHSAIRGGISQISLRKAKANNPEKMHMVVDTGTQWFCLEIFNFEWCVCKRDKALRSKATQTHTG